MSEGYGEDQPDDLTEGQDEASQEVEQAQDQHAFLKWAATAPNIADHLSDSVLGNMGAKVVEGFDIDIASRKAAGYDEKIETALKLASLAKEAKNYPWPNAANVKFPLIIQAAIQFNARSYAALIDGPNVVKGVVEGETNPDKQARAQRIARHMSYQLLCEMEEWEDDTDQLLLRLAIVGTLVRKTYFDPVKGRPCSDIIGPEQFVVNYKAKRDLAVCPRATHVLEFYPHEIAAKMRAGLWLDVQLGPAASGDNDDQAPHEFLEQHCLWDLDGDDYPEPYVVTVHKETQRVVRVAARFDERGIKTGQDGRVIEISPTKCFTKYGFIPSPDGAFYDIGFGTLLGPMSETINSSLNQLMDAGHLANVQGGFIGSGVSIKSGSLRFQPGEWKKVEAAGQALSQSIVPLPVKEPSAVLFNLMTFLIDAAKELTATQDILSGDSSKASTPVGTVMALIEQGLKTFTAIVKRVHRSLKHELGVLYDLNSKYLDPQTYFNFQDQPGVVAQQDYAEGDVDVVPVSDPTMATDMQKMGRVQFLMSMRGQGLNDMAINQFALETAGIPDPKRFLPQGPPPPNPQAQKDAAAAHTKQFEAETDRGLKASEIAVNEANAQATMLQTFMAGPQFQAAVAQFIDQRVQQTIQGIANAGQPQPQLQQGRVPGMEGQPGQPGVLPVPPGHLGGPGPEMGVGGADVPGAAGQGPAVPGAGGPGMV